MYGNIYKTGDLLLRLVTFAGCRYSRYRADNS